MTATATATARLGSSPTTVHIVRPTTGAGRDDSTGFTGYPTKRLVGLVDPARADELLTELRAAGYEPQVVTTQDRPRWENSVRPTNLIARFFTLLSSDAIEAGRRYFAEAQATGEIGVHVPARRDPRAARRIFARHEVRRTAWFGSAVFEMA